MALRNADKDPSEQRDWIMWNSLGLSFGASYGAPGGIGPGGVQTGITLVLSGPMPYPYVVQSANAMAVGASGAPQLVFAILRPAVGGMTTIPIGISNMVVCQGTSFSSFGGTGTFGGMGYSGLAPTGSTLLLGQRGDLLVASTAIASTACTFLTINIVVQKVQDIIQMDGV
jgi:hypothetical protein